MTDLTLSVPTTRADAIVAGDLVEVAVNDAGEIVYGRVLRADVDGGLIRLTFASHGDPFVPEWMLVRPASLHDVR